MDKGDIDDDEARNVDKACSGAWDRCGARRGGASRSSPGDGGGARCHVVTRHLSPRAPGYTPH